MVFIKVESLLVLKHTPIAKFSCWGWSEYVGNTFLLAAGALSLWLSVFPSWNQHVHFVCIAFTFYSRCKRVPSEPKPAETRSDRSEDPTDRASADKCPLGRGRHTNVPASLREKTRFPTLLVGHDLLSEWETAGEVAPHSRLQPDTNHLTSSFPGLLLTRVSSEQFLFYFISFILFFISFRLFYFIPFQFIYFISFHSILFYFISFISFLFNYFILFYFISLWQEHLTSTLSRY